MFELDGATLTYEQFRRCCLVPNRPAIIRNASQSAGSQDFHVATLLRRLSPQSLLDTLGPECPVPVYPTPFTAARQDAETPSVGGSHGAVGDGSEAAQCSTLFTDGQPTTAEAVDDMDMSDSDECCKEVALLSVLRSWASSSAPLAGSRVYYLKDWHLQEALETAAASASGDTPCTSNTVGGGHTEGESVLATPRSAGVHGDGLYRVPSFLGADWMDPFCHHLHSPRSGDQSGEASADSAVSPSPQTGFGDGRSDYRFAYIGPVGSWTPLHCDVFGTYSWSLNVCGDKLWFFPTAEGNAYLHTHLLSFYPTPPDVRVLTGFEVEAVVQRPGDLVFVPARYYHQVHNVTGECFALSVPPPPASATRENSGDRAGNDDGTAGCAAPSQPLTVGPLTMALNHNWCSLYNVEAMAAVFLADAQRLVSQLSVADVEVICGTSDVTVWRQYVDAMLHSGSNWSYASFTSFLRFCLSGTVARRPGMLAADEERSEAVEKLQRLLAEVTASYASLFLAA